MEEQETHVLVASSNRGRYALDDPEHGHDLTSGEPIEIEVMNGIWIAGHVEHSGKYDRPGCYTIADRGKDKKPLQPLTEEGLQKAVRGAMQEGMSLADALSSATMDRL